MEKSHGSWGDRTITFRNDLCLVTILELEPNQRCSWHTHKQTWNQFFVISGLLGVKTDKGYITKVLPGQCFTVEPFVRHEFQTYNIKAVVQEIAYVRYDDHDIERLTLGGPLNEQTGN